MQKEERHEPQQPIQIFASDKIPSRKRGFNGGVEEKNVVKIYHERTDSVGKPLMNSKTFTKKDMDAHLEDKRAKEKEPAYLTNNFNDVMQ